MLRAMNSQSEATTDVLVENLCYESALCRNDGANDIADLLDEAAKRIILLSRKCRGYDEGYKDAMNKVRIGCGLAPNP